MSHRRGSTGLVGILPVDKPAGMTSHDVVSAVRRSTGEGRVGHAGTLDPMATGLLVVLVGPATRLAPWLSGAKKTYVARFVFGTRTDTDDAEGAVIAAAEVPAKLTEEAFAATAVQSLEAEHLQVPPAFSAIKSEGRVAHRAARAGQPLELEPRPIRVLRARLLHIEPGPPTSWDIELTVSKGTYVRALARDLGHELGTEAHLGALRRVASGNLTLRDASTLERVEQAGPALEELFADPAWVLGFARVAVDDAAAALVSHGSALGPEQVPGPIPPPGSEVSVVHEGFFLGVYESDGEHLHAAVVLPRETS